MFSESLLFCKIISKQSVLRKKIFSKSPGGANNDNGHTAFPDGDDAKGGPQHWQHWL